MKKTLNVGFTLVELLISLGIFGVISVLVLNIFVESNKISATVIDQTTLQQELRSAGSLMVDELQRAVYVYPPCGVYSPYVNTGTPAPVYKLDCLPSSFPTSVATGLDVSKLYVGYSQLNLFSSGNRGAKPDGTYNWIVGDTTAPILAMITAPSRPWAPCEAGSGNINEGSCYAFVAYFAVRREQVTRGYNGNTTNGATAMDLLEPNVPNKDQWVLMEYRLNLSESMRYYSSFSSFLNNKVVPGVGKFINSGDTLQTINLGNFAMPAMRWRDAGCDLDGGDTTTVYGKQFPLKSSWMCDTDTGVSSGVKLPAPSTDPGINNQVSLNSLPALAKGVSDPNQLALFAAKMTAITLWVINNPNQVTAKILVDNIEPAIGFSVEFPSTNGSIDTRGVSEVRLRLQGGVIKGGTHVVFPNTPLEYYGSPRNIAP